MFLGMTSGLTLVQARIGIPLQYSTAKIVYTNVCFMDVYVLVSFPTRKWQKNDLFGGKFSDVRGLQPRNPITWAVYWKPYHHRNGGLGQDVYIYIYIYMVRWSINNDDYTSAQREQTAIITLKSAKNITNVQVKTIYTNCVGWLRCVTLDQRFELVQSVCC